MSVNSLIQVQAPKLLKLELKVLAKTFNYLKSLIGFFKSLECLQYETLEDGTVVVTHSVSGSSVAYRADGNIDVYTARNHRLNTKGQLLLNCSEKLDI